MALEVTQDYLEYMLQNQIVAAAKQNVAFHNQMVGDINESIKGGALTDADRLQGRERQQAAQARLREALEELEATKIRFLQAVGEPISNPQTPPSVGHSVPKTLDDAIFVAQKNSPRVFSAKADINAADAGVRGARANYLPKINLEGTARIGNDVDGNAGNTNDLRSAWSRAGTSIAAASTSLANRNRSVAPASSAMRFPRPIAKWKSPSVPPGTSAQAAATSQVSFPSSPRPMPSW